MQGAFGAFGSAPIFLGVSGTHESGAGAQDGYGGGEMMSRPLSAALAKIDANEATALKNLEKTKHLPGHSIRVAAVRKEAKRQRQAVRQQYAMKETIKRQVRQGAQLEARGGVKQMPAGGLFASRDPAARAAAAQAAVAVPESEQGGGLTAILWGLIPLFALGGLGYFGWKWYKGRKK